MSTALPALLTGGAVALVGSLPAASALRLRALLAPEPAGRTRAVLRYLPRRRSGAVALGAGAGLLLVGPAVGLLVLAAAAAVPRVLAARVAGKARLEERRHALEACAALAAELRAGRTPGEALDAAGALARGPSRAALLAGAAASRWGGDVPRALLAEASPSAVPEVLRGLAACWQVCAGAGSGLAAAVERLADGLRGRQAQERAVAAALAGPRASAGLLALLPLAGTALAAGLGAHPVHVLLHTPLGLGCLVGGAALDVGGLWWTHRLVARAADAVA